MAHRCMPFVSIVLVSALSGASSGSAQISTVGAFLLDQNLPGVNGTSGNADRFKGFAEECLAEYDLDGWKAPDLSDPGALSYHAMRRG